MTTVIHTTRGTQPGNSAYLVHDLASGDEAIIVTTPIRDRHTIRAILEATPQVEPVVPRRPTTVRSPMARRSRARRTA